MSTSQLRNRIAALRAEATAVGEQLAAQGASIDPQELFELTGELQGVANAVEGAQLVAIAHAGSHETRLTERGPVEVHHELGFIDAMTSSEVSLATGVGQWAAGRKVGLAANLSGRFPRLLGMVVTGELATVNAGKVITACDGLDDTACAAVEAVMMDRLVGMDPARITTVARKVATRIAADQVAAAAARNKKDRLVQVSPGPDGTTDWWARLPAAKSAAAWAAVTHLADDYATKDPDLTLDQARADALLDLLLTNVTVTTNLTLGIPVITGPEGHTARDVAIAQYAAENPTSSDTDLIDASDLNVTDLNGEVTTEGRDSHAGDRSTAPTCTATTDTNDPSWVRPPIATGGQGLGAHFSLTAALISGCEIPGIGFIDADTIEALLTVVPTDIGRALLDARTGTLMESVSNAYRPPKSVTDFVVVRDGTCRMWGCNRPATTCDIDHARPGPTDPPPPPTSAACADATTASSNAGAGPTTSPPTAPPPGPHPPANNASPTPTTRPFPHHRNSSRRHHPCATWWTSTLPRSDQDPGGTHDESAPWHRRHPRHPDSPTPDRSARSLSAARGLFASIAMVVGVVAAVFVGIAAFFALLVWLAQG